MITDLRYAIRMLIKSPAFSVIAIVALALGSGPTPRFSAWSKPFCSGRCLIRNRTSSSSCARRCSFSIPARSAYPNYLDWRAMQRSFTDLALYRPDSMNLSSRGEESSPERIRGGAMSWNMMRIVGLKPILGRDFIEAEDVPGGPKVALISEGLWKRRFGSSKKVLGQQLVVDAVPREIVGVLPNEMRVMRATDVYVPLGDLRADKNVLQRDNHPGFSALGRLKPGVNLTQARADLDNIAHELTRKYPASNTGRTINARTLLEAGVGDYRQKSQSPSGRGRLRAAHRLRERGQPATGARPLAGQGTGGARGDGRESLAFDASPSRSKARCSAWSAAPSDCSSRFGVSTPSTVSVRRSRSVFRRRGSISHSCLCDDDRAALRNRRRCLAGLARLAARFAQRRPA